MTVLWFPEKLTLSRPSHPNDKHRNLHKSKQLYTYADKHDSCSFIFAFYYIIFDNCIEPQK